MDNSAGLGKRYEYTHEYFDNPVRFGALELHQIGELYCEPGYHIESHRQPCAEISYIVSGDGIFYNDGHAVRVTAGDICVNAEGNMHAIAAGGEQPLRYFYMAFRLMDGKNGAYTALHEFYSRDHGPLDGRTVEVADLFTRVFNELYGDAVFADELISGRIFEIMVQTYRASLQAATHTRRGDGNAKAVGRAVYAALRYIDEHYATLTQYTVIAQELGYSYTYLAHIFRDKMGVSIGTYIFQRKMEKAKALLSEGRHSVTQVAQQLGYTTVQAFSSRFRKATGMSPIAFVQAASAESSA